MKVVLERNVVAVTIEGESLPQSVINGCVDALFGKDQVVVSVSGESLIASLNRTNRSNPDPEKGGLFAKGGVFNTSVLEGHLKKGIKIEQDTTPAFVE